MSLDSSADQPVRPVDGRTILPLAEGRELIVEVAAAMIRVVGAPGEEPTLEVSGGAIGADVEIEARDGDAVVRTTEAASASARPYPRLKLTFRVPPAVRARVRVGGGRASFRHLAGCALDAAVDSGTVLLTDVHGAVVLRVSTGRIDLAGVGGKLSVDLGSGAVRADVDALDAGAHRIRNASGSVRVTLAPGLPVAIDARSEHGSARSSYPGAGAPVASLAVLAGSGSVRVTARPPAGDARDASDDAGDAPPAAAGADPRDGAGALAPVVAPTVVPMILEMLRDGRITREAAEALFDSLGGDAPPDED